MQNVVKTANENTLLRFVRDLHRPQAAGGSINPRR